MSFPQNSPILSPQLAFQCLEGLLTQPNRALFLFDEEGTVLDIRGTGIDRISRPIDDIVGKNAFDLYSDVSEADAALREALGGKSFETAFWFRERFTRIQFLPLRGSDPIRIAAYIEDRTDEELARTKLKEQELRSKQALRERESLFNMALETSDDGIVLTCEGKIIHGNSLAWSMIAHWIGRDVSEFAPEDFDAEKLHALLEGIAVRPELFQAMFRQFLEDGEACECVLETRDFGILRINAHAVHDPIFNRGVRIWRCKNITERWTIEKKVRENEHRYRSLFDSMPNGFILCEAIFGEDGEIENVRIDDVNPAMCEISRMRREDIVGLPIQVFFDGPGVLLSHDFGDSWPREIMRRGLAGISDSYLSYDPRDDTYQLLSAFSPQPGQLGVFVTDDTERQRQTSCCSTHL